MASRSERPTSLLASLNEEIVGLASRVVRSTAIVTGQTRDFDEGSGSAWMLDRSHLVTNNHVVEKLVEPIWVRFPNQDETSASLVGRDPLTDLAVLRVEAPGIPPLPLRAHAPRLGELAFAFGSPLGRFPESVSLGLVSGLSRTLPAAGGRAIHDVIQTDCAINPGNSGGPLVGVDGSVIGVNTAGIANSSGIGFAVPAETVSSIVPELIHYGAVQRASLGVSVAIRRLDDDPSREPRMVVIGTRGSAAGDLRRGDIILAINGYGVQRHSDVTKILRRNTIGVRVPVVVWRDGGELTIPCVPNCLAAEDE